MCVCGHRQSQRQCVQELEAQVGCSWCGLSCVEGGGGGGAKQCSSVYAQLAPVQEGEGPRGGGGEGWGRQGGRGDTYRKLD